MLTIHSQPGTSENSDAKHQVQLLLHIFRSHNYFMNRGSSHVLHNQNKAKETTMRKKTSLTKLSWVWVEGTSQHDNQHQKSNLRLARAHVNKIFLVMTKFTSIRLSAKATLQDWTLKKKKKRLIDLEVKSFALSQICMAHVRK